jgi:hypothetical protein
MGILIPCRPAAAEPWWVEEPALRWWVERLEEPLVERWEEPSARAPGQQVRVRAPARAQRRDREPQ